MAKITDTYQLRSEILPLPAIANSMPLTFDYTDLAKTIDSGDAPSVFRIDSIMLDIPQIRGANILDSVFLPLEVATFDPVANPIAVQADFNTNVPKLNWEHIINLNLSDFKGEPPTVSDYVAYYLGNPQTVNVELDGRDLNPALAGVNVTLDIYLRVTNYSEGNV